MNEQLLLCNVRDVLVRLEETIIFALIERAQFRVNGLVYRPGAFGDGVGAESLVGLVLHETECCHAKVRRYTSPDEHPFYPDLPAPLLPPLRFDENPLKPNAVNLNATIRDVYERQIVPFVCPSGDDLQYGSSAVCDVACLQALSRRVHYGKFVAESKCRARPDVFAALIRSRDRDGLIQAITDSAVEARVLARVELKARVFGEDVEGDPARAKIDPKRVVDIYARWIIPMTKEVQVQYLLQRGG